MAIDYLSFNNANANDAAIDRKWWKLDKTERPQSITKIVQFLAMYDSKRQTQYQISTRLYGNSNIMGLHGLSFSKIVSVQNAMKDRLSYNVVQSCTDTVVSKMCKNKPKPLFLTSGGDYKLQRKAKKLDKFVEGIFYENHAHKKGPKTLRDAAVLGDGYIHVFPHYKRVKWERCLPGELYTDWAEAFDGHPRQMHRVKNVDRDVLIEMFPKHKEKIMEARGAGADLTGAYQSISDQVTVVESWRLPSGPESGDGMHCISIPNEELFMEEWEKDHYPFAGLPWSKRMYGPWGQGLAEQIQNIQLEINKILWIIQRSIHLAGSFKILIENGSKIVKEHLNNDIGAIINYAGTPPQYITPPVVPVELYQQLQNLKNSAFEQAGISQLSATSQKPAGLNSGKALREYNDIETDRFQLIGQQYEDFFLDCARLSIECAKEIYEEEGEYEVQVPGKKFIETIDWGDIDLEEDQYYMKIFPVSSLPNEPAGRLQTIQEYIQAGMISVRQGRRLLDFPDLEQVEGLQNAAEDYLHDVLEKIVDDGDYTPPEPEDDLLLADELALEYYQQGKCLGLEEERLELLRRFRSQVNILKQKAMPTPSPQQMLPQANPMATPQSDLIPNIPAGAA